MGKYSPHLNQGYIDEMNAITKSLSQYPGYVPIAEELGRFLDRKIIAGLIGCIIPESGTNHRILNIKEYNGNGAEGTGGWNCGEGLVQWTYWKYKIELIKKYNADPRRGQRLPETWDEYKQGSPVMEGNRLVSQPDGKHIAGLSLRDQMLFLVKYYENTINKLKNENDLAVITAMIYQQKAGTGFYKDISDPVVRAYTTSKNKYKSSAGNHYLQSLKIAMEFMGEEATVDQRQLYSNTYASSASGNSNMVKGLSSFSGKSSKISNEHNASDRKDEFLSLQSKMMSDTPELGREIIPTSQMYDSNILK